MTTLALMKLHDKFGDEMWRAEFGDHISVEYNQDEAVSRCLNGSGARNSPPLVSGCADGELRYGDHCRA